MAIVDQPPPAATPPPATPAPDGPPSDREMTMLEHLAELRNRLVISVLAVIVGLVMVVVPFPGLGALADFVVTRLVEEAPGDRLYYIGPGEAFLAYVQVVFVVALSVAMPIIVYQILAFVSPALYPQEKRYLYMAIPGAAVSFLVGVAFCYYLMVPVAIQFLSGFKPELFIAQWTAEKYLDFVSTFLFWVGLVFELPLVMFFLAKMGVVSVASMSKFRRYALVIAFIVGAIITPTLDPVSQTMVSLPIYALFELGIILARFA
jgi:sec-independent protein translocase protein TatC